MVREVPIVGGLLVMEVLLMVDGSDWMWLGRWMLIIFYLDYLSILLRSSCSRLLIGRLASIPPPDTHFIPA